MLNIPVDFEIVVKKENDTFKASCSMFPEVFGEGQNEEKAIENLADGLVDKMGLIVKTVLDDVLKSDLLQFLKSEARLASTKAQPQPARQRPVARRRMPKNNGENISFQLPSIDFFLRPANIDFTKMRPALPGGLLVLGLRSPQANKQVCFLSRRQIFEIEKDIMFSLVERGLFDGPQPGEVQTPFGMLLGLPMSYN
ncbi:hypothetical protein NO1_0121 [Candidatus Termititenax aidoneus]|uniref:Uncharacterized protein n=1 Tax=Termititenax aidoneus TaxID=2218524 RepID=A0A388T8W0_TERA1|nr:hypothetical protein NO1_0121 [Candidatus Termititenax aidoneus]